MRFLAKNNTLRIETSIISAEYCHSAFSTATANTHKRKKKKFALASTIGLKKITWFARRYNSSLSHRSELCSCAYKWKIITDLYYKEGWAVFEEFNIKRLPIVREQYLAEWNQRSLNSLFNICTSSIISNAIGFISFRKCVCVWSFGIPRKFAKRI